MKCPQCKLVEMVVDKVTQNCIVHKCKKCGKTVSVDKDNKIGK